jgi:hypothetical protein
MVGSPLSGYATLLAALTSLLTACQPGVSATLNPVPLQIPDAPVQHTQAADFGGLPVNGQPVVVASLNKFAGWTGLGWLRNQAEYEQRRREGNR